MSRCCRQLRAVARVDILGIAIQRSVAILARQVHLVGTSQVGKVETILAIQQPLPWRYKFAVCYLGSRAQRCSSAVEGMGVDHWTGPRDVGVCDVEWASQGLRNVKPDDLDPSQVTSGHVTSAHAQMPALRLAPSAAHLCCSLPQTDT